MLEKILESCYYVTNNAKDVFINYDVLDNFILNIDCNNLKNWLSYNPFNILDLGIEKIVNFLLLFEAIDYSFWGSPKWSVKAQNMVIDGSEALLYKLLEYVRKSNNYDFSKVTFKEFSDILSGNIEIPLLEDRYNTLVNISNVVNDKMNGNFYEYIKEYTNDTDLFNLIIDNFSSFIDEREYNGKKIYFYKLAQLLTSDVLHMRMLLENVQIDVSNLVGCADYKIPQTMRAIGILEYSNDLCKTIDSKLEIELSSSYEVEIRASMLVVIDYISKKINIDRIDINDFFFIFKKAVKDIAKPYHLCRNVNY
ncbi:MAG: queuosine salvage family protein [Bacilli bacterium]|nr:queuosine salvage family protein [Bacilli bacterium]